MQTVWRRRVVQAAVKYGEMTPTAHSCCNTCRVCVQTNLMAGALAGMAAFGGFVARRLQLRRLPTVSENALEALSVAPSAASPLEDGVG
jgi:hypothetical protein